MKGISGILFGIVLAVICTSQQTEAAATGKATSAAPVADAGALAQLLMMKEEEIDAMATKMGVADCWKYIKKEFFGGKYSAMKIMGLASKTDEITEKITKEPTCLSAAMKLMSAGGDLSKLMG